MTLEDAVASLDARIVELDAEARTVEDAAQLVGTEPQRILKSLVVQEVGAADLGGAITTGPA